MRTHRWKAGSWFAAGIVVLSGVFSSGAGAQSVQSASFRAAATQSADRSGIDVSEFTDVSALGFLSPRKISPSGRLISDETERMLLAQGDPVYVSFEQGHPAKPGDLFTVFHSSSVIDHPLSGRNVGYVITYLGRVVLKTEIRPGVFKGEIIESYQPLKVGDPVIPFQPISPCVLLSNATTVTADPSDRMKMPVVAAKDRTEVMGQYSVVYMDHGHKNGVHRGNLFEILGRGEPDPQPDAKAPDPVVGYLIVVDAGPSTSTGLVITAKREFYAGTLLRAVDLKQALARVLAYYGMAQDPAEIENNPLSVVSRLKETVGSRSDLPEAFLLLSKLPRCPIP